MKKQVSPAVVVISIIVVLVLIFAVYKMTVGKGASDKEPELPEGQRPGMGPVQPGGQMSTGPDGPGGGPGAMAGQKQPPSPPPGSDQ